MNDNHSHPSGANNGSLAAPDHSQNNQALELSPTSRALQWGRDESYASNTVWGGPYAPENEARRWLPLLRRRRKVIIATILAVVGLTALITAMSPRMYQATSTILVNGSTRSVDMGDMPMLADWLGATQGRSVKTQLALLKKPSVEAGALARLTPEKRALAGKHPRFDVRSEAETDVINVTATHQEPAVAAALANALCDEFIHQSQVRNRGQVRAATEYARDQLKVVAERLDNAREALKEFKQDNNTIDLSEEARVRVARLNQIENDLRQAQADRATAQAQIARYESDAKNAANSGVVEKTVVRRPAVEDLKAQLTRLEIQRIALAQDYTPTSAKMQALDGQIAALRAQLAGQAPTEVGTWEKNPIGQSLNMDISKMSGQIEGLNSRITTLESEAAKAKQDMIALPQQEYQLSKLTTDMASFQQTYQMLNEKYQTLRLSAEASLANAQIVAAAKTPTDAMGPHLITNLIMASVLGLLLSLGLAKAIDRLDVRVHSKEDAELAARLPVLAFVPKVQDDSQKRLTAGDSHPTALLESFRLLRTNLAFSGLDAPLRTIVVSSSRPSEGKSTSSVNLAIAMALDGKQVVLVDCDLRNPSLHRILGLPNTTGFTSVVAGTSTLEAALQDTPIPGLRLLSSGPMPPNAPELLNSKTGRACLARVAAMADLTVLDTPPALTMADAQIVASGADAAVVVISCHEAAKDEVSRTIEMLAKTGVRMPGVVLNKMTAESGAGYYGRYAYRGESGQDPAANPGVSNGNGAASPALNAASGEGTTGKRHWEKS